MTAAPLKIEDLLHTGGTLHLTDGGSETWRQVTEASLDEYRAHHAAEGYPQDMLEIMAMLEGFVAKWAGIWKAETLIDIGCGIGRTHPPYVRNLTGTIKYAGLDPLNETPDRDYPFICGRLEDLANTPMDKKFDLALFATSLDHFEDARNALSLAAKITNGGRVIILCGLHDSPQIARSDLSVRITDLCKNNRTFPARILAFWAFAFFTWPRMAWALARREAKLAAGQPLDTLHFHYFTEQQLRSMLDGLGTIHEFVRCPGSNGVFAALTLASSAEQQS